MDDLKKAIETAEAELNKSVDKGDGKPEEKSVLASTVEALSKAVVGLAGKFRGEGGDKVGGFEEAQKYLKSVERGELVKLAAANGIGEEVSGKQVGEVVDALVKHLGEDGTTGLAKEYIKALQEADAALIGDVDGGGDVSTETDTGSEFYSPGALPEYQDLCKAMESLLTGRDNSDQATALILKSQITICKKLEEHEQFWGAFAKSMRIPGFDRVSQIVATEGGKKDETTPAATHTTVEVYQALHKAVEEGKVEPGEIAVAKNHANAGVALPPAIEQKLFAKAS